MENNFPRNERLRRRTIIRQLFARGERFTISPFRVHYLIFRPARENAVQILIPVPKQHLHRATDRNLVRRRIREAYRIHKDTLRTGAEKHGITIVVSLTCHGKEIMPFDSVQQKIILILQRLSAEIEKINR